MDNVLNHYLLQKIISSLRNIANHFGLSLAILLTADALVNPYAGLICDARLYAVQALSHLQPELYRKDLFFLFGSQDSFTFFSSIQALAIEWFGLHTGTWILYTVSRLLLYGALLRFFQTFFKNKTYAFIVTYILAAGRTHYIAFDVNEPFLTPRLLAEAFSLMGMTAALRNSPLNCITFLLTAGLLHPIMALGPGAIVLVMWINQKRWNPLLIMGLAGLSGLALIILLKPEAFSKVHLFAVLDDQWREIIIEYGSCFVPEKWNSSCYYGRFWGPALLSLSCLPCLSDDQRRIVISITTISLCGILVNILAVYRLPWILLVQLHLWRSFWLLRIMIPALALLWALSLWRQKNFIHKIAAPILLFPILMSGDTNGSDALWVLTAWLFSILPLDLDHRLSAQTQKNILTIEILFLLLLPALMIIPDFSIFIDHNDIRSLCFSAAAVMKPFFRPLSLLLFILFFAKLRPGYAFGTLLFFTSFLIFPSFSPCYKYPDIIELQRPAKLDKQTYAVLQNWRNKIVPGSVIFTDGIVPVEAIWFYMHACGYTSRMQKGGIIYSRDLSMEFVKRQTDRDDFLKRNIDNLSAWCTERKIDYIISTRRLDLLQIGRNRGFFLYALKLH